MHVQIHTRSKRLNKGVLLHIHLNFAIALALALLLFISGLETARNIEVQNHH